MAEPEKDRLFDHEFDGIREYDNPMPRWWVWLFNLTILFSALYVVYYHFGPGESIEEAYNRNMIAYYDLQAQQDLAAGPVTDATLAALTGNEAMMAGARQLFASKCAQCHGALGEGNIGPNLTDDHWIHGGKLTDIYRTVSEGVVTKGMLAWKKQLRPAELMAVSAYVRTLRGTNPANAKAPEGEPFDAAAEADAAGAAAQSDE